MRRCSGPGCSKRIIPPIRLRGEPKRFCSAKCRVAYWRRNRIELDKTEWFSPPAVIEAARLAMGRIDLDPGSCAEANRIVKAAQFYSVRDDGLAQPWFGKVWLNPPYGRLAPKFAARFAAHYAERTVEQGVLLLGTHHLTTDWFAAALVLHQPILCLPSKRLQFSGSTERPGHGSVLVGIGVDPARFRTAFEPLGRTLYGIE